MPHKKHKSPPANTRKGIQAVKSQFSAPLVRGDSPHCGEMSRSDKGDGHSKWLSAKQTEG